MSQAGSVFIVRIDAIDTIHPISSMHSMTGYGRGSARGPGGNVLVEIQSVNKRQLELAVTLPPSFASADADVRAAVAQRVHRGRLTVTVRHEPAEAAQRPAVNEALARGYVATLHELKRCLGLSGEVSIDTLVRLPGIFDVPLNVPLSDGLRGVLAEALDEAMAQLMTMRAREGAHLQSDLLQRVQLIRGFLAKAMALQPGVAARYHRQLRERLRQFETEIDLQDERLIKELAFFAERCDFSEEGTRLESHLAQFENTCRQAESIGRTLEFIGQEIGRELNTLSAKANDAQISQLVVQGKAELEKMREQMQNVE
ncbi:MAG TPA: YicC/YloC family endoribonuclease [Chthoniobacterales bacterium]